MADLFVPGHDAAGKWPALPGWSSARIEGEGWHAEPMPRLHRLLVSGDLDAARSGIAPKAAEVGLWQVAAGTPLMLRIARDRALFVSEAPPEILPGWHAAGYGVSQATDGWRAIAVQGPRAGSLISQGTGIDLDAQSRSAALTFAGIACLLHREAEDRAILHCEAAHAAYLWEWLRGAR